MNPSRQAKEIAMKIRRRHLVGGIAALALPRVGRADELDTPKAKPILTVSGKIGVFNGDGAARFDLPMLEALEQSRFTTTTPWYSGPVTFQGVRMAHLMQVLKASG